MMLLELREAYPHPPALFEDEVVAQLLQECLDNIPASIKHHSRTPDSSTYKDDRGAESLVQLPLPPPYARVNLRRESAQDSSLVTLPVDEPHQNPRTPTQDPELDLPISHLAHHVPQAVTSIESLASLLHPQPRRILGAPENQSSAISRQNGKLILTLHPLLITTTVGLAFLLYLLWCN
ncbi:hypothetical protein HOY82DRAFT_567549 [Tuber indicum]|nr:hypothetical protein HOY82DRAFT_567549 [Tuber indicum]